ncbi:hypothetical protein SedNR2807_23070 [Citrobacter sedlakii]
MARKSEGSRQYKIILNPGVTKCATTHSFGDEFNFKHPIKQSVMHKLGFFLSRNLTSYITHSRRLLNFEM